MFRVGQKVVCVDAERPSPSKEFIWGLVKGKIYTVSKIGLLPETLRPGINVEELGEKLGQEVRFAQARFRPLVERKTDISIFKNMLNKQPEKV